MTISNLPSGPQTQRTFPFIIANFIRALKSRRRSEGTLDFYRSKLSKVAEAYPDFGCDDLSAEDIREFLITLQATNNPGGVHAYYRAMRALWYWYELEYAPDGWSNPMRKVRAPNVPDQILSPVSSAQYEGMLRNCSRSTWHGVRDRAVILVLNSTGVRASELFSLTLDDVDMIVSTLVVKSGKGGYPRALDFDKPTKLALKSWLGIRGKDMFRDSDSLFVSDEGLPLTHDSLRRILTARAAGLGHVTAHMFRRKHALELYRAGRTKEFIALRLGHHGTAVVDRYIKLSPQEMIDRSLTYS